MNNSNEINLVIFDLFGTLIKPCIKHHPFRQLLKWARENGRQVLDNDARTVMTINGDVKAISNGLGIRPSDELIKNIEEQIDSEIVSLSLFDDVIPTLNELRLRGIRIGFCSNLAQPYGRVISRLLTNFDAERFLSYEIGAIKPEPQMYGSILNHFNCDARQCLFIGDTYEADYAGPTAMGMSALHLNRNGLTRPNQIMALTDIIIFE